MSKEPEHPYIHAHAHVRPMHDNINHGKHTIFFPSGEIQAQGYYINGQKYGRWKTWILLKKKLMLESEGIFINGQRYGEWKFLNPKRKRYSIIQYWNNVAQEK